MGKSIIRLTKIDTILVLALVVTVVAITLAVTLSTASSNPLQTRVLALADLPPGWMTAPTQVSTLDQPGSGCLADRHPKKRTSLDSATASFYDGSGLPVLGEYLTKDPSVISGFAQGVRSLAACRTLTFSQSGHRYQATVARVQLRHMGRKSAAFALSFTEAGLHIVTDLVLFTTPKYFGELVYADTAPPSATTVEALTTDAVMKAEGQRVIPEVVSITATPVRVAATGAGSVGYREIGRGPPLVMIMGYSGSMQTWDPHFIDALAQHHRIVVFDNAGVGATQALPAPLSIDAMADQTSALINTLGLKRPDILGWSMGGMIAQALAVEHPSQVDRLILCATFPGIGDVKPSQSAINDLRSSNTKRVMSVLFPTNQASAVQDFEIATSDYPTSPSLSASTVAAQTIAVDQWFSSRDVAGQKIARINVPTLVADGTEDLLDPVSNDHALASLIPNARLVLLPDAGHAFLFQDAGAFVHVVDAFLN